MSLNGCSEAVALYQKLPIDGLKRRSYAQSPPTSPTARSPVSLPQSPGSPALLRREEHGLQGSRTGWLPGTGRALPCPRAVRWSSGTRSVPTPSFAQPLTSEPPTSSYLQAANGGQTAFYGAGEHKRPEQLGSMN